MRELKKEFNRDGFKYIQIERNGRFAIYGQWLSEKLEGEPYAYEVIIIQNRQKAHGNNANLSEGEYYPSPEQWGERGWTYRKIEDAEAKLDELIEKEVVDTCK